MPLAFHSLMWCKERVGGEAFQPQLHLSLILALFSFLNVRWMWRSLRSKTLGIVCVHDPVVFVDRYAFLFWCRICHRTPCHLDPPHKHKQALWDLILHRSKQHLASHGAAQNQEQSRQHVQQKCPEHCLLLNGGFEQRHQKREVEERDREEGRKAEEKREKMRPWE